nr:hypothetical protein [Tanacetum cinerariifolium]
MIDMSYSMDLNTPISILNEYAVLHKKVRYAVSNGSGYAVSGYRPEEEDPILRNNKWYQSLVRSFDLQKNNIQAPIEFSLMAKSSTDNEVEARLVEFKNQEIKFCEEIRGLEFKVESKANRIENLTYELETLKKEKEGLNSKLTGFKSASKDIDNLLESQISDKNKEGLGYSVVPPPPAQVYSPPKKDMSWTGLPEFIDDTITDYSRPSPAIESNSDDPQNKNPSVTETGASSSTILSKPAIKFVKAAERPTKTKTYKVETVKKPSVKYAEMYKKLQKGLMLGVIKETGII